MRDKYFESFIEEMGEADSRKEVPPSVIDDWRGKLPNKLLDYWRHEGWCSYANGLFWTVNPSDYSALLEQWLQNTPLVELDTFHIIARTAFGRLYACGEKTGCSLTLDPLINAFIIFKKDTKPKSATELDKSVEQFFDNIYIEDVDEDDDENDEPLFERAFNLHGSLASNEIFGFVPALILGGDIELKNIQKLDLFAHLDMIHSLSPEPTIEGLNLNF